MPTRPLSPLKFSQSARPVALAGPSPGGRSAIPTARPPSPHHQPPPAGWRPGPAWHRGEVASTAALGFGVGLGADHGDAAAAVVPALHVAPGEGAASERLGPASDSAATKATSNFLRSLACSGVSRPWPRRRGWTTVSRLTARVPACRWGLANRWPQPSAPRACPGPGRETHG